MTAPLTTDGTLAHFRGDHTTKEETKEKTVTEPKKKIARTSLKAFPDAVIKHLEKQGKRDPIGSTALVAEMMQYSAWKKASMSGMANRLTEMGKAGRLINSGDKVKMWSLPKTDPGPEPLDTSDIPFPYPPQATAPLFEAKIFADHVEISLSDWIMLMKSLEQGGAA